MRLLGCRGLSFRNDGEAKERGVKARGKCSLHFHYMADAPNFPGELQGAKQESGAGY